MNRRRNVAEYIAARHPNTVQDFYILFVYFMGENVLLATRLSYKTSKFLINNCFYDTYDLAPPFSRDESREAWIREWLNVFSAAGRNAGNIFRHILLFNGMHPDNILNVLLHKIQSQKFLNFFAPCANATDSAIHLALNWHF